MRAIFYLVLFWVRYFTLKMFTCSPQDKTIAEIIKITPFKSLGSQTHLCGYLDDLRLFLCFVMVVHESLVCSEQLNWALFFRKILHVLQILQFSSIFCIFEPFPVGMYDIGFLSISDIFQLILADGR